MTASIRDEAAVRRVAAQTLAAALPGGYHFAYERAFRWSSHFVYEGRSLTGETHSVIVKVLRAQDGQGRTQSSADPGARAAAEFRALQMIEAIVTASGDDRLTAVHPYGALTDIGAVVMAFQPARDFRSMLSRATTASAGAGEVAETLETAALAGRLIAHVHARDIGGAREIAGRSVALHGDLYPDNVMRDNAGRVFVLDTGLSDIGYPAEDLAKFVVGVDTLKERLMWGGQRRATIVDQVKAAFLSGYATVLTIDRASLTRATILAGLRRRAELQSAAGRLGWPLSGLVRLRLDRSMGRRLQSYLSELED